MRIPKKLTAFGHCYRVKQQKKIKGGWLGEINYQKHLITILDHRPQTEKEESLLHEACHLVNTETKQNLKEKQVDQMAMGLYHILRDNKFIK